MVKVKHAIQKIRWFLPEGSRRTLGQLWLYLLGCVLFSLGVKSFIDANLGTDPLHAMIIGIVQTIDLPFIKIGFIASSTTVAFLIIWTVWNRRLPPVMTFVTMALVGYLIDFPDYPSDAFAAGVSRPCRGPAGGALRSRPGASA